MKLRLHSLSRKAGHSCAAGNMIELLSQRRLMLFDVGQATNIGERNAMTPKLRGLLRRTFVLYNFMQLLSKRRLKRELIL